MNKVKKIMLAFVSLLFTAVSLLSFAACNQPPKEENEKIKFSWDMSALTVAIERSYAKATGRKSESVLDGAVLNDIIPSVDYEEIQFSLPFERTYLYSVEIESISEFYVEGGYDDIIGEYCGSGPYRVLVADFATTHHQLYVSHSSDYGFRERYFVYPPTKNSCVILEGSDGRMLCAIMNSLSVNGSVVKYTFGASRIPLGVEIIAEEVENAPSSFNKIEIISDVNWSFVCEYDDKTALNENGCRNEYTVRQDSVKTYEMHDEYLVTDLVVPTWYNKAEYVNPET